MKEQIRRLSTGMHAKAPLLPSLFDRLNDNSPTSASESPSDYAVSDSALRNLIRRDLAFLLNTVNLQDVFEENSYPQAESSCLNFGIPPLTGLAVGAMRWAHLETRIRLAIERFEPRLTRLWILPLAPTGESVVRGLRDQSSRRPRSAARDSHLLRFEIRADISCRAYPLAFTVQSAVDLETSRLGGWTEAGPG